MRFYEVAAHVIPVLFLALVLEIRTIRYPRFRRPLEPEGLREQPSSLRGCLGAIRYAYYSSAYVINVWGVGLATLLSIFVVPVAEWRALTVVYRGRATTLDPVIVTAGLMVLGIALVGWMMPAIFDYMSLEPPDDKTEESSSSNRTRARPSSKGRKSLSPKKANGTSADKSGPS